MIKKKKSQKEQKKGEFSSGTAITLFTTHAQDSVTSTFLIGFLSQLDGEGKATM